MGKKAEHCGRQAIKFTPEVAQLLIDVNNKHWGQLSFKRLAGKLAELDIDVTLRLSENGAWNWEWSEDAAISSQNSPLLTG